MHSQDEISSFFTSCAAPSQLNYPRIVMRRNHLLVVALISTCLAPIASCFVIVTAPGGAAPRRCLVFPKTSSKSTARGMLSFRTGRFMARSKELQAKKKKSDSGRPSLDDVERLSRGQAAKKRGTGSRGVCHRLNESERKVRLLTRSFFGDISLICVIFTAVRVQAHRL